MNKIIVYKNDDGLMSIIYPTQDALLIYGIDAIAKKDVPFGKKYKILSINELPNKENRLTWIIDDVDLSDGVGNESNTFNEQT